MKKNLLTMVVCVTALGAFAEMPSHKTSLADETLQITRKNASGIMQSERIPFVQEAVEKGEKSSFVKFNAGAMTADDVRMPLKQVSTKELRVSDLAEGSGASELRALYWKPEGTMFIGLDRNAYLEGFYGGIVGAWRNGIESWVFPNYSTGADSVSYANVYTNLDPEFAALAFQTNENGDLVDIYTPLSRTIPMSVGSICMPRQIATAGGVADTFALSSPTKDFLQLQTTSGESFSVIPAMLVAGAPYDYYDGMWPLTHVPIFDCNMGGMVYPIMNASESGVEYILGSTSVTVPIEENRDTTLHVIGYQTAYEKPQSELYVKSVSLWLTAYDLQGSSLVEVNPVLNSTDTLFVSVLDKEGNVLINSSATGTDLVDCSAIENSQGGSMLTFPLQERNSLGMVLSEGVTLNDEFSVMVWWKVHEDANFAVQTVMSPYVQQTVAMDERGLGWTYAAAEPLMMLNGVYNTFEYAFSDLTIGGTPTDEPVNELVFEEVSDGVWEAYYDERSGNLAGRFPLVYSSFYPMDTLTMVDHYTLSGPEWVTNWVYDDTYWNNSELKMYDIIGFTFRAEPLPAGMSGREGDVTISCYGKSMTFHVTQGNPSGIAETKVNTTKLFSTSDAFNFTYTDDFTSVDVYNVNGQKVSTYALPQTGTFSIAKAGLADGVYMFRMNGKTTEVLRAVK